MLSRVVHLLLLLLAAAVPGACCDCRPPSLSEAHVTHVTLEEGEGPRILGVVAHPDDETTFAGTLYKVTRSLHGVCDLVVLTNGEAGYRYSTLAEPYYGLALTEEEVGRHWLPEIRGNELLESCQCLCIHDLIALGQRDYRYTQDLREVLDSSVSGWDLEFLRRSLRERMREGHYDFVFTLVPSADTHGHHKAATLLALQAWSELPENARPVILAASTREDGAPPEGTEPLPGFPLTARDAAVGGLHFDRCQTFGYKDTLDYRVVVRWSIAAHKSQGTLQGMPVPCEESYQLYTANPPGAAARAVELFNTLAAP